MRKSERLFQLVTLLQGRRTAMTDPALAEAARRAEAKILAVLTPAMLNEISRFPYCIPNYAYPERDTQDLLRKACELRLKVSITYRDNKDRASERTLWPLGMDDEQKPA